MRHTRVCCAASRSRAGFTLIELLVVTAMVGILAALVLPALSRLRETRERHGEGPGGQNGIGIQRPAHINPASVAELQPYFAQTPVIEALQMDAALRSSYKRAGMGVLAYYEVTCKGRLRVRPGGDTSTVSVAIPFPREATEIRNARLLITPAGEGAPSFTPDDALFHNTGIYWQSPEGTSGPITAEFEFTALGRELLVMALPPARQRENVKIEMRLDGVKAPLIPESALQPTDTTDTVLTWAYDSIVTDLPLVVEIPGSQSPMGRLTLLSQLVGAAVFLFGLGFWYLSELAAPGQLSGFRWGHFLLLALTFSLYFVFFGVLSARGMLPVLPAVLISALFSLPLLIAHVTRVLNLRFALTRALPLALVALGLVTVGVYGGRWRDYVFLGATLVILAFMTFTYGTFLTRRNAYLAAHPSPTSLFAADKPVVVSQTAEAGTFCSSCGRQSAQGIFCIHCGARRPELKACPHCGTQMLMPWHMLDDRKPGLMHCPQCGARVINVPTKPEQA